MATQRNLLLLSCWLLFITPLLAPGAASFLHPVVLLPGFGCSQLDARLTDEYVQPPAAAATCTERKGTGWFRLWENYTASRDPGLVPCYADQLRLVYDPLAGDYRDAPGVEIRVVAFGTTRGFGSDNPTEKNECMEKLVKGLHGVGYREGKNLFGAPYDFRHAPAPPGMPAFEFSRFTSSLRVLVERASEKNGDRPVILVTHSLGGPNAMEFLNQSPLPWRRRFIKHLVMVAGAGGSVSMLQILASGVIRSTSPPGDVLSFGNTTRTFPSMFQRLPSPKIFGHAPLVITRTRNYSAYEMPQILAAVGFSDDEVRRYRTRALPVTLNLRAPAVPFTGVHGAGVPTAEKLVYRDGDFGVAPEVTNGDGDGLINLVNVLALNKIMGDDPGQPYFKSVLIPNATHTGIISDDTALERVINEIIEANRSI